MEKLIFRSTNMLGCELVMYLVINAYTSISPFLHVALGIEVVRVYRPNSGAVHEV